MSASHSTLMSCWLPAHSHCSLFVLCVNMAYIPKLFMQHFRPLMLISSVTPLQLGGGSLLLIISRRLGAFMRRSATLGYREDSTLTFDSICTKADEKLFSSITGNRHHLLHPLLPPQREQRYSLRDRSHNLQLPTRTSSLKDNNFLICMLYNDITFRPTCAFSQ